MGSAQGHASGRLRRRLMPSVEVSISGTPLSVFPTRSHCFIAGGLEQLETKWKHRPRTRSRVIRAVYSHPLPKERRGGTDAIAAALANGHQTGTDEKNTTENAGKAFATC